MLLRKIRIALATICFTLITLLFLDFTGTLHGWLGWLAKIQFLPAVLALNVGVVALLVVLTLLFGRIYCSVICPLGVLQDLLSHLNRKPNRFTFSPAKTWLRLTLLALCVVALVAGFGSAAALLAPYSSFGRIAQNLLQPLYLWANNGLALLAEHYGSYAIYHRDVWMRSLPTFVIAATTLVVLVVLAWRGGRTYCNTLCPVGTVLGYLSRFSRLKVVIDADACKNCLKCERNCKASCIDLKNHTVDYTRCVACGNCLTECKFSAIAYGHKATIEKEQKVAAEAPASQGRREFLVGAGTVLATAALAQEEKTVDGGLAVIEERKPVERHTPLTPPGSYSARNMSSHCTACQLCVSQCPNDVLRPSSDLMTLMQPTMSYERGYCRPECNRCSQVCPTGAIKPLTLADKSSTQIGHAVWVRENCLPANDGAACGICARHCPVGAITMVELPDSDTKHKVPVINEARCIGCGACENLCAARPFTAIYVEGHEMHKQV